MLWAPYLQSGCNGSQNNHKLEVYDIFFGGKVANYEVFLHTQPLHQVLEDQKIKIRPTKKTALRQVFGADVFVWR